MISLCEKDKSAIIAKADRVHTSIRASRGTESLGHVRAKNGNARRKSNMLKKGSGQLLQKAKHGIRAVISIGAVQRVGSVPLAGVRVKTVAVDTN